MAGPRDGDTLCPTGAVVLRGRRGVLDRNGTRCTWTNGTCTWCGKPVTDPRRKTWCSKWCVDAFSATQPSWQRGAVEDRDQGVCALCRTDTNRLKSACGRYHGTLVRRSSLYRKSERIERLAEILTLRGKPTTRDHMAWLIFQRVVWWDMDHQIPIVEGGHPFDLRNLRTLCWWCHKGETARCATRRAERRRGVADDQTGQVGLFGSDPAVDLC